MNPPPDAPVVLHCGNAHTLAVIAFDQITALRDHGWTVWAACQPDGWEARLHEHDIPLLPIELPYRAGVADEVRGMRDLHRLLGRHGVAIVHTHNAHHGIAGRLAARLRRVPSVHTWRYSPLDAAPPGPKRVAYAAMEATAARAGDAVLFQNREDLDYAVRSRIVPRSRAVLVGNGIPVERHAAPARPREEVRAELGVAPDAELVVCVARLVERKHQSHLVTAAAALKHRERLRVVLAGSGEDEHALRAQAAAEGMGDRVVFAGEVKDVTSLLWASDLLCLPSRREGVPRVVMEAMACRLAVVATDVVGTREVVRDGETGMLVPFADPPALAAAIAALLDAPERRVQLAERAYEALVRDWHQDVPVRRTSDLYASLLRGSA